MRRLIQFAGCVLWIAAGLSGVVRGQQEEALPEVTLSEREIGRLDIFEDRALSEADAAFDQEEYAAARTRYEAFLQKHADSPAAPYAIFRKARCAELAGKPAADRSEEVDRRGSRDELHHTIPDEHPPAFTD